MKKINFLSKGLLFAAFTMVLVGCVGNEYDLPDASVKNENPLEGVVIPDGFDYSTTTSVKINATVSDEFNGKYNYLIEIFAENPLTDASVKPVAAGVAKSNTVYATEIILPKAQTTFFVKQTDPRGLVSIKSYDVASTVNVDFSRSAVAAASASAAVSTRANAPAVLNNTAGEEYTSVPAGAIELTSITTPSLQSNTNYKISSNYTGTFVHWGTTNTKLFVSATWTIPGDFKIENGLEIIVMNGGKIVNSGKIELVGTETKLLVMKSGEASLNTLELSNQNEIYNLGKFSSSTIINNPGNCYNGVGATFTTNNFQAGGGTYVNDGVMNFNRFETTWGCNLQNNCTMNVASSFIFKEGKLNLKRGSITAATMEYNNTTIKLDISSMLKATSEINFNGKTEIDGSGTTSLVKSPVMLTTNDLLFKGNLVVEVNSITQGTQWWSPWKLKNPAQMTTYNGSNVVIETCGGTVNEGNTGSNPQNPSLPIVVEDENKFTYTFEDGWPLYGDYDMNDLVLRVNKKTLTTDNNNSVLTFSMEVEILAVGATKNIAAALQLDNVLASDISQAVTYGNKPQSLFSFNSKNIEESQKNVVLPLFSNAHEAMGVSEKVMVNTYKNSKYNTTNTPKFTFTINLPAGKYTAADFNNSKLNFFIITNNKASNRLEVHLPGYKPTDLADQKVFGRNNDATDAAQNKYYVSHDNLSWAIMVPQSFRYPLESVNMTMAYQNFSSWLTSGGSQNADWFSVFSENKVY